MQSTPDTTTMSADVRDLQIVSTTFNKKEIGGTQVSYTYSDLSLKFQINNF